MYESIGYETYSESKHLKMVRRSTSCRWNYKRGFEYEYENTPEGMNSKLISNLR
jgi:hypothetical protein